MRALAGRSLLEKQQNTTNRAENDALRRIFDSKSQSSSGFVAMTETMESRDGPIRYDM
jgi:hypothetical protein